MGAELFPFCGVAAMLVVTPGPERISGSGLSCLLYTSDAADE